MGWQAHSKREHPSGGSAEPEKKCPLSPLKMPPRKKFAFLTSADHNFSVYLTKLRPREEKQTSFGYAGRKWQNKP